eukprot:TRINITY_DN395_c0_g2_i1.p1 TRINITY_DN395_c0_g2~~TRINITY_DN395_c0_g2_i1.p1  ORF type:complete len:391 (-),score=95.16 TRINITY_DN395_c0_g2_i1:103-1275(-)
MKLFYILLILMPLTLQRQPKPKQEKVLLTSDYLPTTEAFETIKNIREDYDAYREKVKKNVTIDYKKCTEAITVLKCNNIDQWESVIHELKLENENSLTIEIPFLKQRKLKKQMRLRELIQVSDAYDQEMLEIVTQLELEHQSVIQTIKEIEIMYKLPKHIPEQTGFVQQLVNVPASLNTNVADVAGNELTEAKTKYEIADESIQAQTVMNEMISAGKKIQQSMVAVAKAFEAKQKELFEEKQQLKDDIIRIRALITHEEGIQAKNTEKIAEFEAKILACVGQPTNIEKDCEPIRIMAAKLNTEIDIMNARTNLLTKQINFLVELNQSPEQIKEYKEGINAAAQAASDRAAEMEYVTGEIIYEAPQDPKEKKPIHHLKEGLAMHEAGENKQ